MRDKNTSARLCAKNAGGGLCVREGVFAGRYGILQEYSHRVVLGLSYSPDPSTAQSNLL